MSGEVLIAIVFIPGDFVVRVRVVILVVGSGHDIGVAVAVNIRRVDTVGPERSGSDGVSRKVLATVVFIPGNLVVTPGRGQDIHVTVTVQIGRDDTVGPIGG